MEAVGIVAGPIIEVLLNRLASLSESNYARREKIDGQLKKLKEMLPDIRDVLAEAEERQMTDKGVKSWMEDLSDFAYHLDDLLDELDTEALRLELIMPESHASSSTCSKVRKFIPTCCTCFSSAPPSSVKLGSKMMSRVEEITARLEEIETRKRRLVLIKNVGTVVDRKMTKRSETVSSIDGSPVYGRANDREAILELLLRDEANVDKLSVIPILGMGGIGKTTLAQLVYNDQRLEGRFDLKAWVCVSDDYDVFRVTKAVLEAVTLETPKLETLNMLHQKLKENLSNKRFLLVLDDVWNENYEEWKKLCCPFLHGAHGSKIIVTTRLEKVANITSTLGPSLAHHLKVLSIDECLSLFAHHALGRPNFDEHAHLKGIGEKIVDKCKGLPLAAKTLGGLLRNESQQRKWDNILNSKIWDLSEEQSGILPALRLSYHHLPSHLKQCFAYCAIFSKDYEFDKGELVLLWMAVGLLQLSTVKKQMGEQMEDYGNDCFEDLLSRSFFQQSSGSTSRFVMHDLLNDLALHVAGDICFKLDKFEGGKQFEIPKRARHLSFIREKYEVLQKFSPLYKVLHLRTFLPLLGPERGDFGSCYLANKVLLVLFPKLQCVRVLSLSNYDITEVPDSIGDLKHLRYLNLSGTSISRLPESVTTLYNLQTLLLHNCKHLHMLPSNIENLINLRHLDITNTSVRLQEVASGIGRLANLQTLSTFIVDKMNGQGLKELKNLRLLRGSISIRELQNVIDVRDADEENLRAKQNLEEVEFAWCREFNDSGNENLEINVLDKLQPHRDLKRLRIEFYGGTKFSSWIGHPSFSEMVNVTLVGCRNCRCLPALGQLPKLKELHIEGMDAIKKLGVEFYGVPFPSLERLIFECMPAWEEWSCSTDVEEAGSQFPCLRELRIYDCPKLIRISPLRLPSLRTLNLQVCDEVVLKSMVDLTSLTSLDVRNITGLSHLDEALFQSWVALESLSFCGCNQLVALWKNGGGIRHKYNLLRLKRLSVLRCLQLVSFGEELDEGLPCINLQELDIHDCVNLEQLPDELNNLTSLASLEITDCPKLVGFPKTGVPPMLKELHIQWCKALQFLPDGICGLEHLSISDCSSLRSWPSETLPTALKTLTIYNCMNLEYFSKVSETTTMLQQQQEDFNNTNIINLSSLEELSIHKWAKVGMLLLGVGRCVNNSNNFASLRQLRINNCAGLECLSFPERGLPNLRILDVRNCDVVESLSFPERGLPNLTSLLVYKCKNLRSLPTILQSLESLEIEGCESLESFPESGGCLSSPNLRSLTVSNCVILRSLPTTNTTLQSLQSIEIKDCPCLEGNWNGNLPLNLIELSIRRCGKLLKPLSEWGLNRLTSLRQFHIDGGFPELVSFPPDEEYCLLSTTLTDLTISDMPNLKSISSKGLQNLTSLQHLNIWNCRKLRSLPKEGMPSTLQTLQIFECPLIYQRCLKDRGDYWPNIAHVPCVRIER